MKLMILTIIFVGIITLKNCNSSNTQLKFENRPQPEWLQPDYQNTIMIEPFNTVEQNGFYLIDQPIDFGEANMPSFFLNMPISLELFKNTEAFYPELDTFILVVPDWNYYQKVAEDAQKKGITIEPTTSNYYYYFIRKDGSTQVEEYYISGEHQPVLHYKIPEISKKENLIVYRQEQYYSMCCPRDNKHDLAGQDADFIKKYEKQQQVSILGSYTQKNGKEGEHVNYYTLQGLSSKQRLAFLLAKNEQWKMDGKGLFDPNKKRIITPTVVPRIDEEKHKIQLIDYK